MCCHANGAVHRKTALWQLLCGCSAQAAHSWALTRLPEGFEVVCRQRRLVLCCRRQLLRYSSAALQAAAPGCATKTLRMLQKTSLGNQAITKSAMASPSRKGSPQSHARMQHAQHPSAAGMARVHVALRNSPDAETPHVASAERAQEPPGAVPAERVIRRRQVLQSGRLQRLSQLRAGLPAARSAPSYT